MIIETEITIDAPVARVWQVVIDIENASETIEGIEKIEILEKPEEGLVGLKWRETRTVFGKTAIEEMWVTEAVENDYYLTRAESHGCVYLTTIKVAEGPDGTTLMMSLAGKPVGFLARLLTPLMSLVFKGSAKKMIQKDLEDIKVKLESGGE